ncbi:hypothetical protein EVAR_74610_1 [Eumeta japonica]|uniref:Uncharacterized protein n=1 Tax=Eumeta variegata TaxID=151549 RepID=A0A4C1WDA7_EUMVA|nr:hypothetical protein EVAR_74610_1 [Eumeta japonica]
MRRATATLTSGAGAAAGADGPLRTSSSAPRSAVQRLMALTHTLCVGRCGGMAIPPFMTEAFFSLDPGTDWGPSRLIQRRLKDSELKPPTPAQLGRRLLMAVHAENVSYRRVNGTEKSFNLI